MGNVLGGTSGIEPGELLLRTCEANLCDTVNGYLVFQNNIINLLNRAGQKIFLNGNTSFDSNNNQVFITNDSSPKTYYIMKVKDIYKSLCEFDKDCRSNLEPDLFSDPVCRLTTSFVAGYKFEIDFGNPLMNCIPQIYLNRRYNEYCTKINNFQLSLTPVCGQECGQECNCKDKCESSCDTNSWKNKFNNNCFKVRPDINVDISSILDLPECKYDNQLDKLRCDTKRFFDISNLNEITNKLGNEPKPKLGKIIKRYYKYDYMLQLGDILQFFERCPNDEYEILIDSATFNEYTNLILNKCN